MFKKSKLEAWWDSLDDRTKTYLKNQPIWKDSDLYKFAAIAAVIGFLIGVLVGYESAWRPVVSNCIRPFTG